MKLVVFDFDGTLTKKDSFVEFIKFSKGKFRFRTGLLMLLPVLVLYKFRIIHNWSAKESVLKFFFKGDRYDEFRKCCHNFALHRIDALLRPEAVERFHLRKKENARIIIVTASAEDWIKPWTDRHDVELIGTRLQVVNGRITGKIEGINCYGLEKVTRLKEKVDLSAYSEIEAYGDSEGDKELMKIATTRYYKHF
jgi:phosphatidylglycerophosphatase C